MPIKAQRAKRIKKMNSHHQVHQQTPNRNAGRRERKEQKKCQKIKNFPNLLKNNLHIQEIQQTPNSINVKIQEQIHHDKNNGRQRQDKTLESSKRKISRPIHGYPIKLTADLSADTIESRDSEKNVSKSSKTTVDQTVLIP